MRGGREERGEDDKARRPQHSQCFLQREDICGTDGSVRLSTFDFDSLVYLSS